ncbi:DNA repair protein RecO [Pseudodesulfovibrio tunisiensis]|uniref:DNA repair protein RecO n=1 Tax=Pseudodesulfovibrio tunisiensis TaxID=463192 RepID=UPI001FB258A5|nr:DNA repair protein RecO [Pseudodesulfovibrio tunisiensis]
MAMVSTEKAVVLKVGKFKEADCWVRLLSPSRGIFNAFAFGGCRSRRRFCGCLDPLNLVLFSIGANRSGSYSVLEEGSLLNAYQTVKTDPARTGIAVNCTKFLEKLELDAQAARPVFELAVEMLNAVEQGGVGLEAMPWMFRIKLAFEMGYAPSFVECGLCGSEVGNESGYRFSVERGQVVCPACHSAGKSVEGFARPVTAGALRVLDWIHDSRPAEWSRAALSAKIGRQCRQMAELFVAYHLGLSWENGFYKQV